MVIGMAEVGFHNGAAELRIGLDKVFRELLAVPEDRSGVISGNSVGQCIQSVRKRDIVSIRQVALCSRIRPEMHGAGLKDAGGVNSPHRGAGSGYSSIRRACGKGSSDVESVE